MGERVLYIDAPVGVNANEFTLLSNKADVVAVTERYMDGITPVKLDCRGFKDATLYQYLLKFVESYRGDIWLVCMEPVPETILSRFTVFRKHYTPPKGGSIWLKVLGNVPHYMRDKVGALLGIEDWGE